MSLCVTANIGVSLLTFSLRLCLQMLAKHFSLWCAALGKHTPSRKVQSKSTSRDFKHVEQLCSVSVHNRAIAHMGLWFSLFHSPYLLKECWKLLILGHGFSIFLHPSVREH